MNFIFDHCAITGMLTVVPSNERKFVDEMSKFNFPVNRSLKLKEIMGYDRHRVVEGNICVSDLVVAGMQHLFSKGLLQADAFDALILVTQSPDYIMPPTSNVIQGRLGLKQDLFCLDINQGCAGFIIGLMQAFMLLRQPSIERVLLVNADVLSRKVSARDRNSYPLIGDAASITLVERSTEPGSIRMNLKMDGTRCDALRIPAGGMRIPSSQATSLMEEDRDGNFRSQNNLVMDGAAVFNFAQVEVPPMIEELLGSVKGELEDIDMFLFHQPNRFMLQKLAEKLRIPSHKMPVNIVELYGNSSGVSIPMAITHNLCELLMQRRIRACLAGFGVGLTWASMLMPLGPLQFCEMIEFA
jgi:3-oxoacyl-[acyl-carrier-protein] synthase-3